MTWRRFAFFSQQEIAQAEAPWVRSDNVSASCALDDGRIVVADRSGICHVLSADRFEEEAAFGAHDRGVTQLVQPCGSGLLFSLGTENSCTFPRRYRLTCRHASSCSTFDWPSYRSLLGS